MRMRTKKILRGFLDGPKYSVAASSLFSPSQPFPLPPTHSGGIAGIIIFPKLPDSVLGSQHHTEPAAPRRCIKKIFATLKILKTMQKWGHEAHVAPASWKPYC